MVRLCDGGDGVHDHERAVAIAVSDQYGSRVLGHASARHLHPNPSPWPRLGLRHLLAYLVVATGS